MVKGIIFDIDGTILDSMSIWMIAGRKYLESMGCEVVHDVEKIMFSQTMSETAQFMIENYLPNNTEKEIISGIDNVVAKFYKESVELKNGVLNFLKKVYELNIPMVVATSTDRIHIEAGLNRAGIGKYFKKIFTTTECESSKREFKIFNMAMEELGTTPEETWLCEDALYSINTGKKLGINAIGIYDDSSKDEQEEIKELVDIYLNSWDELDIDKFF